MPTNEPVLVAETYAVQEIPDIIPKKEGTMPVKPKILVSPRPEMPHFKKPKKRIFYGTDTVRHETVAAK